MRAIPVLYYAIALIALLAACSPAENSAGPSRYDLCNVGVHRTSTGVIRACGPMSPKFVEAIERELKDGDKEIILTSGGGSTEAAMQLARILHEKDVGVRARQFCLSACSTYVLLTAPRVSIDPYTIVAFHYTGAFNLAVIGSRSGLASGAPALRQVSEEKEFFSDFGLDPELLNRFSMAIEPSCMGMRATPNGGRERFLNYRNAWFIPTPNEAASLFNGKMSGYWPQSKEEAQSILRPTIGDPEARLVYGWPSQETIDPEAVARTLPDCS